MRQSKSGMNAGLIEPASSPAMSRDRRLASSDLVNFIVQIDLNDLSIN